jgi:pyruvate/2-oxoglutarate/acetoin dehydrogenase E1 component/TPP-dependent pyruvate/acetoin dehydrogenase alpha subunit
MTVEIPSLATALTPGPIDFSRERVLADYRVAYRSRQVSLLGRKEVLTGKAKFGIFGDGKEVAQVALARFFEDGDLRAGYYRDQTLVMALGLLSVEEYFAQLYAHADPAADPASAGRQMNSHFATPFLGPDGELLDLARRKNVTADLSPTGSQMPRLVGLAQASRLFRELPELARLSGLSRGGREVAWGTIGNASCAEGMFWEAVNAVGVLGGPLVLSIWDDGYGISVPNEIQVTKGDLSELLQGFRRRPGAGQGYDLYTVRGWDYVALLEAYERAARTAREEHVPAIVHVVEMTQPQGHSTSGSHERYKTKERLAWEEAFCCLRKLREWIVGEGIAGDLDLDDLEAQERTAVRDAQQRAWEAYRVPLEEEKRRLLVLLEEVGAAAPAVGEIRARLERKPSALRRDLVTAARDAQLELIGRETERARLSAWIAEQRETGRELYSSHLWSEGPRSALAVPPVPPRFHDDSPTVNGFEVLNHAFDLAFARDPRVLAFGEDVGQLGDVNQGMAGLQEKYGALRVADTGIRECTILGQAIGLALRGLRPIAEIQYLDYLLYALQILSDDLATLRWRTKGHQKAPVIVRTRGHRLEGVWHSGSPMGAILHLLRGIHVCVPRDMTRAAGFYNTLLAGDDPGLVIEVLNGYRLKERLPDNLGEMTLPLGVPEVLREGSDITVVTYGATCRVVLEAADQLARVGIETEVVDVQTLLPFDRPGRIVESLQKTNRVVFVDEDVPGGATAFMLRQVLEEQDGYHWLDSPPRTLPARDHRPAYASDGDYFSKPNREDVFDAVYGLLHEAQPRRFPRW